MVVKMKKRASIEEGFIFQWKDICVQRRKIMARNVSTAPPHLRQQLIDDQVTLANRLKLIATDEWTMATEIARLRGVKVTEPEYSAVSYREFYYRDGWFIGVTSGDIVFKVDRYRPSYDQRRQTYLANLGPYAVAISRNALKFGEMYSVHLIPERRPLTRKRHPHHLASDTYDSDENDDPKLMDTNWCYDGFAPIVTSAMTACDLPSLFAIYLEFMVRHNADDPLTGLEEIGHISYHPYKE